MVFTYSTGFTILIGRANIQSNRAVHGLDLSIFYILPEERTKTSTVFRRYFTALMYVPPGRESKECIPLTTAFQHLIKDIHTKPLRIILFQRHPKSYVIII